jgi:hypothetical protein
MVEKVFRYRKHRVRVQVHPTLAAMRRASGLEGLKPCAYAGYVLGATRNDGARGTMHFAEGRVCLEYVIHEATHAGWHIGTVEAGSICRANDEGVAYAIDDLATRIWKWLRKAGFAGEE